MSEDFDSNDYGQIGFNFEEMPQLKTLQEAREYLLKYLDKGVTCPCCYRFNKVYKRNFNAGMARSLILISKFFNKNPSSEWIHVQRIFAQDHGLTAQAMDYIQLRHWGLMVPKLKTPDDNEHIKHPGLWKITEKGVKVVSELTPIPKRVFLLNNRIIGFDPERRTIVEALGKKFSYPELMNN